MSFLRSALRSPARNVQCAFAARAQSTSATAAVMEPVISALEQADRTILPSAPKANPINFTGFKPASFARHLKPHDFVRNDKPPRPYKKRPYLGPSATESKRRDVFYQLNIDPLHEATNSHLMSRFVSEMGKIQSRAETGLTWKNQRRMGKAIRRAKMMGIIPALSKRALSHFG
ncbi:hypothetical protein C8Q75DRAFT_742196 [Abortiporus biennis]|nr:hypothetical protein C8Q75DRAFT_742196 [Abortiporus biennis]